MTSLFKNKKIALLYGGESSEREVSLSSGAAVQQALEALGLSVVAIDVKIATLAEQLLREKIEHCFIALHGGFGEDGTVQALLNSLGISYTGSNVLGCALAMDKQRTKLLWQGAGIATAAFVSVDAASKWADVSASIGSKMMIKPACEGSSIGMSLVENEAEFNEAMALALRYDTDVIAEKWISGNEYTVAILGDVALPMIRLKTDHRFYDYEAKYQSNDTQYICPCGLDEKVEQEIQQQALQAFKLLGCSGWGRVDVMTEADGSYYFLEANTVPGMTDHSLVPMAAKATGKNFTQLVAEILALSMAGENHVAA
jgi:D-alanine-D-alanine ligase